MENNSKKSNYESPLRYPGGKACIFPFISKIIYENNLIGVEYAEPYAGGAGLALKLLFNEYVNRIHINDLDYSIYSFWKTILESNGRFCNWIENLEVSINNWKHYKNIQNNAKSYNQFEVAQALFFLNRTNISGVIKGGPIGGFKQEGKYKVDARFNREDLINRIRRINNFRDRIIITNRDGLKFINHLNKFRQNCFVYLDPPYFQKGADLYMNYYKKQDHSNLANKISQIKHKWLVSYDNHEFILNLYNKHRKMQYSISQSASNRLGNEILVFSDNLSFSNSLNNLTNPTVI